MFCYSSKIESEVGVRARVLLQLQVESEVARVFCYSSKVEWEVGVRARVLLQLQDRVLELERVFS